MSHYLICRNPNDDSYRIWDFTPGQTQVFKPVQLNKDAKFSNAHRLAEIGNYILEWGPREKNASGDEGFPYRLFEFDPESGDPLNGAAVQSGTWPVSKFWGYRKYYSSNPNEQDNLNLYPMGNFMLFFVGGEGRGTYELFNFDPNFLYPNTSDPLPAPYTAQDAFPSIQAGHELTPVGNYVLDRLPDGSSYRIWSFDPQNPTPLSIPAVYEGKWKSIHSSHKLLAVGNHIMAWLPESLAYTLYAFNPASDNPFGETVSSGFLPSEVTAKSILHSVEPKGSIYLNTEPRPGSMDYMRSKIKHVVYYMLESRSFDNVCGWLYDKPDAKINFIGSDRKFDGASTDHYNMEGDKKVYQSKFKDGKLSDQYNLSDQLQDPFHGNSDALEQMFYQRNPGYPGKAKPDMGGFVRNNANEEVMLSLTPEQLPVLNGLAENFAISDEWFSSVPGGTDINRAFSVTGSALNQLFTWEGGNAYEYWAKYPRRQSLWKVLWSNGIKDFKIYNAILWQNFPFTYHLYLEGQVPSIDNTKSDFLGSLEKFKEDALSGNLPSFSFLEPVWIAPNGTTSYHPGADLVPGERALNEVYEAIKNGPHWKDTLFVVTFSKNGGIYDHAIPPYASKPWPNDNVDDFYYDLMGPRVPAIMVSPWIKKNTVIRSGEETPFDSTSFAATLLKWYGIPRSKWSMGDRIDKAPTFEKVFQEEKARTDAPTLTPPYDKSFPR